jgi:hypothetical protein
MSTDTPYTPSDVELLHCYLGKTLQHPDEPRSLDDALAGFEKYYRQLRGLRENVRQAEGSLERGQGKPLDVEAVITRVRARLAEAGIAD